jgi:Kef-type K+ transport system membrane component KefB
METDYKSFCVFIGTAMSITAFPVLARILREGNLILTRPGAITMSAAAVDDAVAWCLLTLAISMSNAGNDSVAGYNFMCVVTFAIGLLTVIRAILEKIVIFVEAFNTPLMDGNLFAFILICVFLSSWTTSNLGVHYIFGAFLFGLIVPRKSRIFHECTERIEVLILTFNLPLYFALSGLKTDITQADAGMVILVIVIATVSKFIGCGFTSYFVAKMDWRESCVIAVLMNTRGLIELIVLNIGLKSKILNTRTFSTMVIMCLFTTLLTNPLVEFLLPVRMRDQYLIDAVKNDTTESTTETIKNNTDTTEVTASTSPLSHRISVC